MRHMHGTDGVNADINQSTVSAHISHGLCCWLVGPSKCSCFYREMLGIIIIMSCYTTVCRFLTSQTDDRTHFVFA